MELSNVSVSYGANPVIFDVSFQVLPEDKLLILGRNGVGKTTLLKGIMGILPSCGHLNFQGKDISQQTIASRSQMGIAYVPQGREIFPSLTVEENLRIGALYHDVDYLQQREEILEYFPILKEHMQRKGGVLSGGQQQQLAIARALMGNPSLLMLDEPTEGIQPNIVSHIFHILSRYHQEKHIPIVVVEQNLQFARRLGNRFLIIQKGCIVRSGAMNELTDDISIQYLSA